MTSKLAAWSALGALGASLIAARPALADSHKLLVLQSEGRADASVRAKIDAAIVKLAKASEPQASAGDITYSDAAAAVGCKPEAASCKDEVIGTFAVDELVITTVTPKPGGIEVAVHRVAKGGVSRDASAMVPTGQAPQLDALATVFSSQVATKPADHPIDKPADHPVDKPVDHPADHPVDKPADHITTVKPGDHVETHGTETGPVVPPPDKTTTIPTPPIAPLSQPEDHTRRHRLELAGMGAGGGMLVLGIILWTQASSAQSDIKNAPDKTRADIDALRSLESKADGYATWGNVLAITGIALGGVSGYFYWRDRRAGTQTARLGPAVFDHGAGIALTLGGSP